MAADFPTTLPSLTRVSSTDAMNAPGKQGDVIVNKISDEIEAIATQVGITGSTVPTSIEYRLAAVESVASSALPETHSALGSFIAASTEQADPADDDALVVSDASAGAVAKKVTWSSLKKMARKQATRSWRFRGKLLIDGSTSTGWSVGSGSTLAVVTKPAGGPVAYRTNSNSVLRITTATGIYKSATVTVAPGIVTTPRVDLWIYIEDPTTIVEFTAFFATSDAFSDYYSKSISPRLFVGWQVFSVNLATASVTGSPTYETIARFRIQIQATTTAGTSILFDSAWICPSAKSKCALIWDDGQQAEYTHTLPLLNKYNLVGNFAIYAIPARLELWRMLAHCGHRLIVHGTQVLSTFGTLQQAKDAIIADAQWVADLDGPGCDPDVYVYPGGSYMYTAGSLDIPQFLEASGFVGAFATANTPIVPELGVDPYILHRLEINASTVAATWLTALDAHLNIGLCFALCAHVTVSSGATGDQVNKAVLDEILSGIRTRVNAGSLEVVTAKELILQLKEV